MASSRCGMTRARVRTTRRGLGRGLVDRNILGAGKSFLGLLGRRRLVD